MREWLVWLNLHAVINPENRILHRVHLRNNIYIDSTGEIGKGDRFHIPNTVTGACAVRIGLVGRLFAIGEPVE